MDHMNPNVVEQFREALAQNPPQTKTPLIYGL